MLQIGHIAKSFYENGSRGGVEALKAARHIES